MKIKLGNGLLIINLMVALLVFSVLFTHHNVLRIILAFPFVFCFPGYILTVFIYPRKNTLSMVERIALTIGLSIATVSLISLILNYTTWGVGWDSLLFSIGSFIVIMSFIGWLRQKTIPVTEKISIEFYITKPKWNLNTHDKFAYIILVICILCATGMISFYIFNPKIGQQFTEFYILGQTGDATHYRDIFKLEEASTYNLGIVNHEKGTVNYRVVVKINGVLNSETESIVIARNGKWEGNVTFIPSIVGENQPIEFFLFKNNEVNPYLDPLRRWITILN